MLTFQILSQLVWFAGLSVQTFTYDQLNPDHLEARDYTDTASPTNDVNSALSAIDQVAFAYSSASYFGISGTARDSSQYSQNTQNYAVTSSGSISNAISSSKSSSSFEKSSSSTITSAEASGKLISIRSSNDSTTHEASSSTKRSNNKTSSKASTSKKATSTAVAGSKNSLASCGNEVSLIFYLYSVILSLNLQSKSLMFSQSSSKLTGESNSTELFQQMMGVLQPDADSDQKDTIKKLTVDEIIDGDDLQISLYNSTDGFSSCFDYDNTIYKGIKTWRGVIETFSAEVPELSAASKDAKTFLEFVYWYGVDINEARYNYFEQIIGKPKKSLSSYNIIANDTLSYIQFNSSDTYPTLSKAVTAFNKDNGLNISTNIITDIQTIYEFTDRINSIYQHIDQ